MRKKGEKFELSICGHAEYAPNGYDIVCSAVSAIYDALAVSTQGKERITDKGVYLILPSSEKLDMAMCGFGRIAQRYPENVKIV